MAIRMPLIQTHRSSVFFLQKMDSSFHGNKKSVRRPKVPKMQKSIRVGSVWWLKCGTMESSKLKEAAEAIASTMPLPLLLPWCRAGQPMRATANAVRPAASQVEGGIGELEKPRITKKKPTRIDLMPIKGETMEASPARKARKSRA